MTKHVRVPLSRGARFALLGTLAAWASFAAPALRAESPLVTPALLEVEVKLQAQTGSLATLESNPVPTGKRPPTNAELAAALKAAIEDKTTGTDTLKGLPADQLIGPILDFRPAAAPVLVGNAIIEVLDGGKDGSVSTLTGFTKQNGIAGRVITVAFAKLNFSDYNDDAAVVSALTAQAVSSVTNAPGLSAAYKKIALKSVVANAVKAVLQKESTDPTTQINTPTGLAQVQNSAGVATGAVTQLQKAGSNKNDNLVKLVVKAATKASLSANGTDYLQIAQAAAEAAAVVFANGDASAVTTYMNSTSDEGLVSAVLSAFPLTKRAKIKQGVQEAVAFGLTEATAFLNDNVSQLNNTTVVTHAGAGAKGVANFVGNSMVYYGWQNANAVGTPVTDISGF